MKTVYKFILPILLVIVSTACNEEEFLDETPLDFFSPNNAYINPSQFDAALANLDSRVRDIRHSDNWEAFHYHFGTDIFFSAREGGTARAFDDYLVALNPTYNGLVYHWERWYKIISNANIIISRLPESEVNAEQQVHYEAEARFYRAYAYRFLVYLFGGVPLYTEEISTPRNDFTRASKEEVLAQIVSDAEFAANNLKGISEVQDGKVSNLVAQHLLAETYISQGEWAKAIAAATVVIDDPNTALMTERFGTRATEVPGDVYWDLFRRGNQNRSTGNTEALWVIQMEFDVPGGLISSSARRNSYERWFNPVGWTMNDPDGNEGFLGTRSTVNAGGRGASFIRPTSYFENELWSSDFDNDMRNANHNYHRTVFYDNPESAYFGMSAIENKGSIWLGQDWRWYPYLTKTTTPDNHPEELYLDPELKILKSSAGSTFRDAYELRLAETYLLRAEAHLGNGDPVSAAADINVVRARVNANPVAPGDVDIDYILDERARELSVEEPRRITLQRLGKLVERVRQYNAFNADDILDYHDVWPIPYSEIEANINGDLAQNPGY